LKQKSKFHISIPYLGTPLIHLIEYYLYQMKSFSI